MLTSSGSRFVTSIFAVEEHFGKQLKVSLSCIYMAVGHIYIRIYLYSVAAASIAARQPPNLAALIRFLNPPNYFVYPWISGMP